MLAGLIAVACSSTEPQQTAPSAQPATSNTATEPTDPRTQPNGVIPGEGDIVRGGLNEIGSVDLIGDSQLIVEMKGHVSGDIFTDPCAAMVELEVIEEADQVTLQAWDLRPERPLVPPPVVECTLIDDYRNIEVLLEQPLGDRKIINGKTRDPISGFGNTGVLTPSWLPEDAVQQSAKSRYGTLTVAFGRVGTEQSDIFYIVAPIDDDKRNLDAHRDRIGVTVTEQVVRSTDGLLINDPRDGTQTIIFHEDDYFHAVTTARTVAPEDAQRFVEALEPRPSS